MFKWLFTGVIATYIGGIISFSTYHGIVVSEASIVAALGYGASWPGMVIRALAGI